MVYPGAALKANEVVGRFYDRVRWIYPVVDVWMAEGKRRCIERINAEPPGDLLEMGVGPGRHVRWYRGHRVSAMDVSASMVRETRRRCPGCRVWHGDGERSGLEDASFDLVALFHVLSVTANPDRMLAEAWRLLRPGGRVYVLNRESGRWLGGWAVPGWRVLARWLRLSAEFRLDDCAGAGGFQRVDRWSYGPAGMFTGMILRK